MLGSESRTSDQRLRWPEMCVGHPVMNAARDWLHVVWLVWHCVKRTPPAASRSRFGIATSP